MKKHRFYLLQLEFGGSDALDAAESTTPADIFAAVRALVVELFGDVGVSAVASALAVKYYSPATRLAVVRGPADPRLHAAIALVKAVRKRPAALRVLSVTSRVGALRAALVHWSGEVGAALRTAGGSAGPHTAALLPESFFEALEAESRGALQ